MHSLDARRALAVGNGLPYDPFGRIVALYGQSLPDPQIAVVPLLGIIFLSVGLLAATAAIRGVRINTSYSLALHGTDQHLPNPREAPPSMASLIWFRVVGAGAIGLLAWRGQLWAIPLSIVVPCLIAVQPTRSTAGATSFAYYAAASLPVIGVAKAYWPSSEASAVFMWMAAAALLSVPWLFCWTRLESLRPWTAAIAVALSAAPPICIIGWASPPLSAGVLLPDSAWLGIAAALALPGFLIHKRTRLVALVVASAASVFLNIHAKEVRRPNGWVGEMTRIHRPRKADDIAGI